MTDDTLDPLIHVPSRLRILVTLAALNDGDTLSFTRLQNMLDLTPATSSPIYANSKTPATSPRKSRQRHHLAHVRDTHPPRSGRARRIHQDATFPKAERPLFGSL
jgi:hypothetical protein